jgi:hypothetical protein
MNGVRRAIGGVICCLAFAATSRAETIQITAGGLEWFPSVRTSPSISLVGDGFTFDGVAHLSGGNFVPRETCLVPQCVPGTTVSLTSVWVGNDVPGTAMYDGRTFDDVGHLASETSLAAEWTGSLLIPVDFTGGTLQAPFSFSGRFSFFESGGATVLPLTGSGLATLGFTAFAGNPGFFLSSATYTFEDPMATPEPVSMVLVGTGLAGLAALRHRRGSRR